MKLPKLSIHLNDLEKLGLEMILTRAKNHMPPQVYALLHALLEGTLTDEKVQRMTAILNE